MSEIFPGLAGLFLRANPPRPNSAPFIDHSLVHFHRQRGTAPVNNKAVLPQYPLFTDCQEGNKIVSESLTELLPRHFGPAEIKIADITISQNTMGAPEEVTVTLTGDFSNTGGIKQSVIGLFSEFSNTHHVLLNLNLRTKNGAPVYDMLWSNVILAMFNNFITKCIGKGIRPGSPKCLINRESSSLCAQLSVSTGDSPGIKNAFILAKREIIAEYTGRGTLLWVFDQIPEGKEPSHFQIHVNPGRGQPFEFLI